ncbi:MAG: thiolase family protein [Peptococcaceae bacterium]|jgi:acetyl-CoA acyltransferase|nr:thiolase family protein [Peptococcaceae bacterium]MDH7525437.1 thiolase family protein [Peptococcaceae bacterium]
MAREVFIAAYGRSAICRAKKGSFAETHPIEYSAQTLKGVLARIPQLDHAEIEDVIMGCSFPHNETGMNIARLVVNRAELPDSVSAQTINRFCSSGLQAIATAAGAIMAGQGDVVVAGGVEDMSHTFIPYDEKYQNKWLSENYPGAYMSMGITAENVAERYKITREEMDRMAVESHRKAFAAQTGGKFVSIVPVTVKDAEGNDKVVVKDEGIRPDTSMESLASLKPCFKPDGVVTAATSSQVSDAAAFIVLLSGEKAAELGIKPVARLVSFAVAGCDATVMGLGPIHAVPKAMRRAGLSVDEMDVVELNEAFAAQAIPCIKELGLNPDKVNPYGGAIALGHPLGATGVILTCKALDYLKDNNGKYGLVTMCIGGGMGAAGIFELL